MLPQIIYIIFTAVIMDGRYLHTSFSPTQGTAGVGGEGEGVDGNMRGGGVAYGER